MGTKISVGTPVMVDDVSYSGQMRGTYEAVITGDRVLGDGSLEYRVTRTGQPDKFVPDWCVAQKAGV